MSNIFWKRFHFCFSSLKCLPSITPSPPPPLPSKQDQNNNNEPPSPTTTTSTSSSILINNFNIYDLSSDFSTSKAITHSTDDHYFTSDTDSDAVSPPDFTTIYASQRFFFSSPGLSNSIIESSESTKLKTRETAPFNGGIPVKKYSPDPYQDFRCSMQEMVEARNLTDVMGNWDFLHELLLCYLTLNPKHTHKLITDAFADTLISLLSSQDSIGHRKLEGHRRKPRNEENAAHGEG